MDRHKDNSINVGQNEIKVRFCWQSSSSGSDNVQIENACICWWISNPLWKKQIKIYLLGIPNVNILLKGKKLYRTNLFTKFYQQYASQWEYLKGNNRYVRLVSSSMKSVNEH